MAFSSYIASWELGIDTTFQLKRKIPLLKEAFFERTDNISVFVNVLFNK